VTVYLLDTTVLIDHLRGVAAARDLIIRLSGHGHWPATTAVNVAELEYGTAPPDRKALSDLIGRLRFLATTREAAIRAGRYRADSRRRGRTMDLADALIAGTARAHGAVLVTANTRDFSMPDVDVKRPEEL
jgi:predicted nucleic acid-binding protein